jgi:hypothetical protein
MFWAKANHIIKSMKNATIIGVKTGVQELEIKSPA